MSSSVGFESCIDEEGVSYMLAMNGETYSNEDFK